MDPSRPGRLSGSLTVIETDTDRCGTYDFLLMIHTNHVPISYRFQDMARHVVENSEHFLPCVFNGWGILLGIL